MSKLFGAPVRDMLSCYRLYSRRFVKTFSALATGFEFQTELTIHAMELRMTIDEIELSYQARPEGSTSKLNTWLNGFRIIVAIGFLYKEVRPFRFFGTLLALLAVASLVLIYPVVTEFLVSGLVPRIPTTGLMLLGFILLACGIILGPRPAQAPGKDD